MASVSSSITATGATTVALNKASTDTLGQLAISGTYTALVFKVQGSFDGTNWDDIALQRIDTGAAVTGAVTPGTNAVIAYSFNCAGFPQLQFNATTPPGSGTVNVVILTGAYVGAPPITPVASFTSATFTTTTLAGVTTATGNVIINNADAAALTVGPNGATNPTLTVSTSTASAATGLKITSAAAAAGLALAVISSGTNENLTIDAKGSGTISLNVTGTGNIVLGRAATGVSLAVTAGLTSSGATGAGIGYATGAGGTVSQATDRTTGVTLSKLTGQITTQATSLAAQTSVAFIVTNTTVALGDTINLSIQSGPTGLKTIATVTTVTAGSFTINLFNTDASTADTGAAIINFAVVKAVAA